MADIAPIDQGWLVSELNKIFRNEHTFECVNAKLEARKAAKELGVNRKSMNGLGQPILEVPAYAANYWAMRYPGCWKDKQFVREFWRDNPECRVKAGGTRIQQGYGGLAAGATKRFTKSYAP